MKFSIIIPCYNYGHSLSRTVESVISQDYVDYEIIIINDGSLDNTHEISLSLREKHSNKNIRYIKIKNSGPAYVRNLGAKESNGDYLIFLDADDTMAIDALETYSNIAIKHSMPGMIVGGHNSIDSNGKLKYHSASTIPLNKNKAFLFYLKKKIGLSNGAVAIRSNVLETIKYNPLLRQSEDIPVFSWILLTQNCTSVNKPTANIYRHPNSLRKNVYWAEKLGYKMVDEIFDSALVPNNLKKLKNWYKSKKALSLFRLFFKLDKFDTAQKYLWDAARYNPIILIFPKIQLKLIKIYVLKFIRFFNVYNKLN